MTDVLLLLKEGRFFRFFLFPKTIRVPPIKKSESILFQKNRRELFIDSVKVKNV